MVNEIQYTSIKRVLDNLSDHRMLKDITLEQVVRHTLRFIAMHGHPQLFQDKIADVEINDFRGSLPCDLVRINQVKDLHTGVCLRSMTDTFAQGMIAKRKAAEGNRVLEAGRVDAQREAEYVGEPTFKTQNRIIYTSFPKGVVRISYKSTPIDEDGFPMIMDDEIYLAALEAYIKERVFTEKFDNGDINAGVLKNAKDDAVWYSGKLAASMKIPSTSEMESLTRAWSSILVDTNHFDNGFRDFGNREYIRLH